MKWPQQILQEIKQLPKSVKYITGIDEVGRGAIAGPMTIGICQIPIDYVDTLERIDHLNDSKKISAKKRAHIISAASEISEIDLIAINATADEVDRDGIRSCYQQMIDKYLATNDAKQHLFLLDYGISVSDQVKYYRHIKSGDSLIPVIALASIYAKQSRDNYMKTVLHDKYPEYGFNTHVGYGTQSHREAIIKYGLTNIHRSSFCQKLKPQPAGASWDSAA